MVLSPPPPPAPPMSHPRLEEGIRHGVPAPPNPEVSCFGVCLNVINTITHLLLGSVAFCAIFTTNLRPYVSELSAHIHLTVIGYVILMSQAILSFNPHTGWANNLKYPQKRKAHWLLQVLGSTLAIVGGAMGITTIETFTPGNHLNSSHAIVGFVALILTTMSFVGGIVNLVCSEKMNSVFFKTVHSCFGSLTLIIAYVALCLGFDMTRLDIGDTNANLAITLTVFALVGTLMVAFANTVARLCK